MKYFIVLISVLAVFGCFALAGAVNHAFQFAIGVLSYPVYALISKYYPVAVNRHLLILPFFILFGMLNLYDWIFEPLIFNPLILSIPVSPLISLLLSRLITLNILNGVVIFVFAYFANATYIISYPFFTKSSYKISGQEIRHLSQNHGDADIYWWGTSCYACIQHFDYLRPKALNGRVVLCCIAKSQADSIRAEKMIKRYNIQSRVVCDPAGKIPIYGYPTWSVVSGNLHYLGPVHKVAPLGYDYSLFMLKAVLWIKRL